MKRPKKWNAGILLALLIITLCPATVRAAADGGSAQTFRDVAPGDWYYEAVNWAVENGVTSGMGQGTFQPKAQLTRAQAVTFLYKLAGSPDVSRMQVKDFSDVAASDWYYDAVKWAVAKKITSGFGNTGLFKPKATCTRAMVVAFLANYTKAAGAYTKPAVQSDFSDVSAKDWYKEPVDWAVENGVTAGYGTGTFSPDVVCNRAMMVSFLKKTDALTKSRVCFGARSWGDRTPLRWDEVPEVLRGKIIDWMYTDFALVFISSDGYLGYIKDGEITATWKMEVREDNFLFDASLFNENAEYRWYGYVGDSIVRIEDGSPVYETRGDMHFGFTGSDWYCYYIVFDQLYFWSPGCSFLVADQIVEEAYTKNGYTFFRKYDPAPEGVQFSVYCIDANAYTIGRQTQEFVDAHPVTPVRLGRGERLYDYFVQLNPNPGEGSAERAMREFEERYGLNTALYGNPTDTLDVMDFVNFAKESRHHIFDRYGIPTENTADMFRFENIKLHGHNGHLRVFYKNGAIDYLSWTCYDHSWETYVDLHEYFLEYGPCGHARTPRDGQIEESAVINGYDVYAGYEDSTNGQYTYAFVLYQ